MYKLFDSPTTITAKIVFCRIYLIHIPIAASALNFLTLNAVVTDILNFILEIIATVVIYLVASAIIDSAEKFIQRAVGPCALIKIVKAALPVIIQLIASFMTTNQIDIAPMAVYITYAPIICAVSLGLALAFGLVVCEAASQILTQAYRRAQAKTPNV